MWQLAAVATIATQPAIAPNSSRAAKTYAAHATSPSMAWATAAISPDVPRSGEQATHRGTHD